MSQTHNATNWTNIGRYIQIPPLLPHHWNDKNKRLPNSYRLHHLSYLQQSWPEWYIGASGSSCVGLCGCGYGECVGQEYMICGVCVVCMCDACVSRKPRRIGQGWARYLVRRIRFQRIGWRQTEWETLSEWWCLLPDWGRRYAWETEVFTEGLRERVRERICWW